MTGAGDEGEVFVAGVGEVGAGVGEVVEAADGLLAVVDGFGGEEEVGVAVEEIAAALIDGEDDSEGGEIFFGVGPGGGLGACRVWEEGEEGESQE